MKYTVYILQTSAGTLYTGQTNNLARRLKEHKDHKGRGAKYMRRFSEFKLVYKHIFPTRIAAMKYEYQIKSLTKQQKEKLIYSSLTQI